jgi:hypothetical protein
MKVDTFLNEFATKLDYYKLINLNRDILKFCYNDTKLLFVELENFYLNIRMYKLRDIKNFVIDNNVEILKVNEYFNLETYIKMNIYNPKDYGVYFVFNNTIKVVEIYILKKDNYIYLRDGDPYVINDISYVTHLIFSQMKSLKEIFSYKIDYENIKRIKMKNIRLIGLENNIINLEEVDGIWNLI